MLPKHWDPCSSGPQNTLRAEKLRLRTPPKQDSHGTRSPKQGAQQPRIDHHWWDNRFHS